MKKSIIIAVGGIIILGVIGVWAYLFTFGAPESSDEIFAKFDGAGDSVDVATPQDTTVDVGTVGEPGAKQALKQLTTKPVAGAGFSSTGIRYVEQGTGHVYEIDLSTGRETLVNSTTIPGAREAVFSTDGVYVAITTLTSGERTTIVGKIGEGVWKGIALPKGATEITFMSATGTLNYFLRKETGGTAYSYNIIKESNTELFTTPLRDVHVLFGKDTYVYTTPTAFQEGFLYKVQNGTLTYMRNGAYSLMGVAVEDGVVVTTVVNGGLISELYTKSGVSTLPISLIPDKCTFAHETTFCTTPTDTINTASFPDDWYKGTVSYSDALWEINVAGGEATVLSNFLDESGREVDVHQIGTDVSGTRIYFVNKNDNALWMFDTTL